MQDGYIFSDTIERNIATGDGQIEWDRLQHAFKVANIESFIAGLPLGSKRKSDLPETVSMAGNPVISLRDE